VVEDKISSGFAGLGTAEVVVAVVVEVVVVGLEVDVAVVIVFVVVVVCVDVVVVVVLPLQPKSDPSNPTKTAVIKMVFKTGFIRFFNFIVCSFLFI
jgi:hypothetical protein